MRNRSETICRRHPLAIPEWLRAMWITFGKIGHLRLAQKMPWRLWNRPARGLLPSNKLAIDAPGHAGWQRHGAISYGKPSAALKPLGGTEAASTPLHLAQAIIEPTGSLLSGQRRREARSRLGCLPHDRYRRRDEEIAAPRAAGANTERNCLAQDINNYVTKCSNGFRSAGDLMPLAKH